MSEVHKLATEVPGFDVITHGGIPEGRSTLVAGRAGTGKTILGLQIASNLARSGQPTLILAVEEPAEDLVTSGDSLNFDLSGLIERGALRVADLTRPVDGPTVVSGDYDLSGLLHRIERHVQETGAKVVVLDSATALFTPRPPHDLMRSLFFQLVHALRRMDLTSVVLAEGSEEGEFTTSLGVEDYVCDAVVLFRNRADGERRRRTVEVNKYRRSQHFKGEYPCTITAKGLAIFPLDAKEQKMASTIERYPSGLPGLDAMIGGGLVRDSIVIVRGPTGSGKTLLAGLYTRAGAARGERVAFYGFEEPRAVLLRNFAQIGMPLEEMEEKGCLRLVCRYPESMGFEDLLVNLRESLEEYQPSLIVLDSISSIEHSLSEKGFRQFMVGLASIIREHSRSALLTQTVMAGGAAEHTAPYLSTIADGIIALDYSFDESGQRRVMRVIKMRGSEHDAHPYRLWIGRGGLNVEKEALRGAPPVRPASPAAQAARLRGVRVLLVEDFEEARDMIRVALESYGAEVLAAGNAIEALDALAGGAPSAIVCDIGLPGEDGYSLLRRIRTLSNDHARVPAVALTAWTLPEDRQRAHDAGFEQHLAKPIDPSELVTALSLLLKRP